MDTGTIREEHRLADVQGPQSARVGHQPREPRWAPTIQQPGLGTASSCLRNTGPWGCSQAEKAKEPGAGALSPGVGIL